ncbi:MAG: NADH-quinone oxidoreductase subunit N [Acidimicrobiia bacterium]
MSRGVPTPGIEWIALAPVIAMAATGLVVVMTKALVRRGAFLVPLSIVEGFVGAVVAGGLLYAQWRNLDGRSVVNGRRGFTTFSGMIALDRFSIVIGGVVVIALVFVLLLLGPYLRRVELPAPEFVALVCFSVTGMLAMATANDLIVVFVALEVLSIPLYVLSALDRRRVKSQEAGLKYFVLGAFSSAIFLYGVALMYGATGSTRLVGGPSSMASFFSQNVVARNNLPLLAIAMLVVGLGFKIAAVPFHQWTPDVYDGAPTPVTAFMASATKAAGFAALIRVLYTGLFSFSADWRPIVWGLSALTVLVGAIASCVQTDVKRILAYSSIGHAGFILIGVQAASKEGVSSAVFYLIAYAFMVVGSFAVVGLIATRHDSGHLLDDYRGLAGREPQLAALLTFFLLAQAGVPLTSGFIAKFDVFSAAARAGGWGTAIVLVGLLSAAIAAFAYLRVVVTMWAGRDSDVDLTAAEGSDESAGSVAVATRTQQVARIDVLTGTVLFVCATVTLVMGVLPEPALELARRATLILPL